jgi:hypothetical protein
LRLAGLGINLIPPSKADQASPRDVLQVVEVGGQEEDRDDKDENEVGGEEEAEKVDKKGC